MYSATTIYLQYSILFLNFNYFTGNPSDGMKRQTGTPSKRHTISEVGRRLKVKLLRYLGAQSLQLRCCHADKLYPFLIVGDGACQVGHLSKE